MMPTRIDMDIEAADTTEAEAVLASRVESCRFWTAVGSAACLLLSLLVAYSAVRESMPQPLATINPNIASLGSLVRLPGIGPSRAIAIIEYRNNHDGASAFGSPADLDAVSGLGPKTIEKMLPWIAFDGVE